MTVEPITDLAHLRHLRPEWDLLWHRVPGASPFQHSAWLVPWREVFNGGELFSFAVRQDGELVAFAPLFLHQWNGRRQVTFLGNGVSDHLDMLAEPPAAKDAWTAILHALSEERHRWDVCDLQDLAEDTVLVSSGAPAPLQAAVRPQYLCSVISLPGSHELFEATLPHGLRRNLRRYRSHLEKEGQVTFETAQAANYDGYLDALFCLHRSRWKLKGESGMLEDPLLNSFHRKAANGLWDQGFVRLHALRLDARIIAVVYAFVHARRAYSYLGGFDAGLARFSPGALIMRYTIDQAIRESVTEFDFLRGRESYKSDWGAKPTVSSRLILWHGETAPVDLLEMAIQ